jgi:hypothetical protein
MVGDRKKKSIAWGLNPRLLRNTFGNFAPGTMVYKLGYLLFGTKRMV